VNETSLPQPLLKLVKREVDRNEKIQWVGMPRPAFFTSGSTVAFLFAVPWTAFFLSALADELGLPTADGLPRASDVPIFILIPFVLAGLGLLSAPLWVYSNSFRTAYVITDRRAITFNGGMHTTIKSYPPEKLTHVYRKEKGDGSGDVILDCHHWKDSDGKHTLEVGFQRVANVHDVELMIKQLAAKAGSHQPEVANSHP
jgi:hypothetical protein